jgi:hypothetical protein
MNPSRKKPEPIHRSEDVLMKCWKCGAENPDQISICSRCGNDLSVVPAQAVVEGDATGGIIPYKNPKALIAYYLGIFSGLPLIGLPIGIAAFILGFLGLRDRSRNPVIKGSLHAGIGIGCGCLFSLLWSLVIVSIVIAIISEH